jgi:hypothetical protein
MFRKIKSWFLRKREPDIEVDPEPKYLIESFFDLATGKLTIVELVCACGWPVAKFEDNDTMEYWCEHCDRGCPEGLPTCSFCVELYVTRHEESTSEDED